MRTGADCKAVVPATKRMSEQDNAAQLRFAQASCLSLFAPVHLRNLHHTHLQAYALQVCAERCEVLPMAKEHRGKSEPLFILYRMSLRA